MPQMFRRMHHGGIYGNEYCSSVCCMFTAKQAIVSKQRVPEFQAMVFNMDVRTVGKDYERYYENGRQNCGIRYLHCAISMIREQKQTHNLLITYIRPPSHTMM
jgi:heterodisulfide reductase subunit A2